MESTKQMSKRCMFCSVELPFGFCQTCKCVLGKNCFTNHKKLPIFGDHVVVELDDAEKRTLKEQTDEHDANDLVRDTTVASGSCQDIHLNKCSSHDTENQTFYCIRHDVTLCGRCLHSSHKSCIDECVDLFEVTVDETRRNETLVALGKFEKDIEEYENAVMVDIDINNNSKLKSVEVVNALCSKLMKRLTDLKDNAEQECAEKHKQNSERLAKEVVKCKDEKLLVCKRKQLIDELVQRKHDRHLYVEIARLEKEKKEIAARIKGFRQDSHSVPFFFKPNVELEKYLLNEIREMGKIQEKVDGSDEILEDTIKICTGYKEENLKFYRNEITSKPLPGNYIEDILQWKGDYKKLESGRSYFQWLFPVIEPPVYLEATQQLFVHEAQAISTDAVLRMRVLRAYTMMLDFFGMELVDETSGEIRRRNYNWKERYHHLNGSKHNHDRITRILKSLGELGYEKLQWPLVKFIMAEAVVNKALPYLNSDVMNRWIAATKNEQEGLWMYKLWQNMRENPERFDQLGNSRASTL